jgi:hypothetical protein
MVYSNSFVVRVWTSGEDRVFGKIEHVGSHDQVVFNDPAEIVGFIRVHLQPPTPKAGGDENGDVPPESAGDAATSD